MTPQNRHPRLKPILDAVRRAVVICQDVQANFLHSHDKVSTENTEPVTIADYASQAIISHAIQTHYPDDAIIAEESGREFGEIVGENERALILSLLTNIYDRNVTQTDVMTWLDHGKSHQASRTWVIDPIDGTKGFVNRRHYAIGVALLQDGIPAEAIIACPGYEGEGFTGAIFYTDDGQAYRTSLAAGGEAVEIRVSGRGVDDHAHLVQSFERAHAGKERMARVYREAGLGQARISELDSMEKYALVAGGDAELYLRLHRVGSEYTHKSWDHAAGTALVITAGGRVTDVDGSPLDFSQGANLPNKGMVVSNGVLHDAVLQAIQGLLNEEASAE